MCKGLGKTDLSTDPRRLTNRFFGPFEGLFSKLKKLKRCRNRKEIDALEVDRARLQSFLDGVT